MNAVNIEFATKARALALSAGPVRALALALIECREQELYIYPTPRSDAQLAKGYRFFCVLPYANPEKGQITEKLYSLLGVIAREEDCSLLVFSPRDESSAIYVVYFQFRKKK